MMQTEQKYRLRFYIDRSQSNEPDVYMDGVYTIDELINKGYITPIATRKVYRWRHSGDILEQTSRFTNCWSYKTLQLNNTIDNITFQECLAAGLIIESEEVVEPEPKPKFKVGDRVRVIAESETIAANGTTIGKIGTIDKIDGMSHKVNLDYDFWFYKAEELEPAPIELIEGHIYKVKAVVTGYSFTKDAIYKAKFNKYDHEFYIYETKCSYNSDFFEVLSDLTESEADNENN